MGSSLESYVIAFDTKYTVSYPQGCRPVGEEVLEILQAELICDEVYELTCREDFEMLLKAFAQGYTLHKIELGLIEATNKICGILERRHLEALKKTLDKRSAERVKKIKEALTSQPRPDFWEITVAAWRARDYHFLLPSGGVVPDVGLLELVENILYERNPVLYISQLFAYD